MVLPKTRLPEGRGAAAEVALAGEWCCIGCTYLVLSTGTALRIMGWLAEIELFLDRGEVWCLVLRWDGCFWIGF